MKDAEGFTTRNQALSDFDRNVYYVVLRRKKKAYDKHGVGLFQGLPQTKRGKGLNDEQRLNLTILGF